MNRVLAILLNAFAGLRDGYSVSEVEIREPVVENRMVTVVADRRRLLKIKLKSLAAEARIIRQEEMKARFSKRPEVQDLRAQMHEHRVKDIREEARATLLAYSFIRGKKYRDIEGRSNWGNMEVTVRGQWDNRMERIRAMVAKYGQLRGTHDIDFWLGAEPNRPLPPRKPKTPYTGDRKPRVKGAPEAMGILFKGG